MTIYRFGNNSVIDEVSVTHSGGGGVRAYLHASEGADPQTLEKIKNALTYNNLKWNPMQRDGKPVIEVRSIGKNGSKVLELLSDSKMTNGKPDTQINPENQVTLKDKVKSNTLRWSGLFYEVGDLAFLTYGWKDSFKGRKLTDPQNLLAGIFYALGSPVVFFFGKGDKSDMQLRHKSYDALQHLVQNGVTIPEDSAILSVTHKHNRGVFRKIKTQLERHPAEITNSLFGIAGGFVMASGFRDLKRVAAGETAKSKASAHINIWTGVSTILSSLFSWIPEEARTAKEKSEKESGALKFIKEKPLRIAGVLLGISTFGHMAGAREDRKHANNLIHAHEQGTKILSPEILKEAENNRQGSVGRGIFTGTNLTAEALMSVSSKGHGEGVESDKSLAPSVYAVIADLITRSAPKDQERILTLATHNLSHKKQLDLPESEVRAGIEKQLQALENNPWAGKFLSTNAPKEEALPVEPQSKQWQTAIAQSSSPELAGAITR